MKEVFRVEGSESSKLGDVIMAPCLSETSLKNALNGNIFDSLPLEYKYYMRTTEGDVEVPAPGSKCLRYIFKVGDCFYLPNNYQKRSLWEVVTRQTRKLQKFEVTKKYKTMFEYKEI